jgi:hypothetical protein
MLGPRTCFPVMRIANGKEGPILVIKGNLVGKAFDQNRKQWKPNTHSDA